MKHIMSRGIQINTPSVHAQLCPTLSDSMDSTSPLGSSVHGISLAGILERVAIPFSRGSSQPRDRTHISCVVGGFFTTEPPGSPDVDSCRITLTSFNVKSLKKACADLQRHEGKESQSERTCLNASQDSENNYKENSLS